MGFPGGSGTALAFFRRPLPRTPYISPSHLPRPSYPSPNLPSPEGRGPTPSSLPAASNPPKGGAPILQTFYRLNKLFPRYGCQTLVSLAGTEAAFLFPRPGTDGEEERRLGELGKWGSRPRGRGAGISIASGCPTPPRAGAIFARRAWLNGRDPEIRASPPSSSPA